MSNRIVFNIYVEDIASGHKKHECSMTLITELSASKVVDFLEVYDGFSAYVVEGIVLSFVDFSCINISPDYVISKLKCLPSADEKPQIILPDKCVLRFERESNDEVLIRNQHELVYAYSRFECGASGFSEAVIQWVTEHPVAMIFIGGGLWDKTKDIVSFLRNKILKAATVDDEDAPIIFSPPKFHSKLAKLMNIDSFYFQITDIRPIERRRYTIRIRTLKNDEYVVIAKANGDIILIEKQ